jgi:hypothetical protein
MKSKNFYAKKVDSPPRKCGFQYLKVDSPPRECGFQYLKVDSSPRKRGFQYLKVDSSPRKCGFQYLKVDSSPHECGFYAKKVDSSLGEVIRLTPCFSWGNVKYNTPPSASGVLLSERRLKSWRFIIPLYKRGVAERRGV